MGSGTRRLDKQIDRRWYRETKVSLYAHKILTVIYLRTYATKYRRIKYLCRVLLTYRILNVAYHRKPLYEMVIIFFFISLSFTVNRFGFYLLQSFINRGVTKKRRRFVFEIEINFDLNVVWSDWPQFCICHEVIHFLMVFFFFP